MSENIPKEEIDKLLEAISTKNDGAVDEYTPIDSRKIRIFDFANPPVFSTTEIAKISCIIDEIGCHLAEKWGRDCKSSIYCITPEPYECSRNNYYKELTNYFDEKMEGHYLLSENIGLYKAFLISDLKTDFTKSTKKQNKYSLFSEISKDFFDELSRYIAENQKTAESLSQNNQLSDNDFKIKSSLYMSALNPKAYSYYVSNTNPSFDGINYLHSTIYEGKRDMNLEFILVFRNASDQIKSKNIRQITVILSYNLVQLLCGNTKEIDSEIKQDYHLPKFADKTMVKVSVSFGQVKKTLKELEKIGGGTIIELDRKTGDSVIIYSGDTPIAKGEIIIIDEHFGIRIEEIL
ncbi:FliM/FliN family flagellar motor switch protein [uncultured Treponema sp.]|uniref:FliM/FliN family flagellar motor switch protein n=1 Tax=uncultured Treponema sp. TaxID=162155 RepID=UPI0026013D8F|nr:FliM/FliN family flagellar motor switch protein [uncultured Treponema sp.]